MDDEDFTYLAEFLRRRSGLMLPSHKLHLIETRLSPVMTRFGLKDLRALIKELRLGRDMLARDVTEAMTTNETSFFRDRTVFAHFRDVLLPAMLVQHGAAKRLRIWSAACATGQEPYSIAMILDDYKLAAKGWSVDLIATDISGAAITRAEEGVYSPFEVQRGLPIRRLVTHFAQDGDNWRASESLRKLITFRNFNLLDSYGWLDDIDILFCRNILIYFDSKTKIQVLEKMHETLTQDGALVLGPQESVAGLTHGFHEHKDLQGFYFKQKPPLLFAQGTPQKDVRAPEGLIASTGLRRAVSV
jgi:chemotaxis protein methyltransferase CheR